MSGFLPRIAPSLLSADFGRLADAAKACESAGADWIHFDVMDGRFVPNLTVGPVVLRSLRKETQVPFDVHLMIEEPFRTLDQYVEAGAARISVHVEAEAHLHRFAGHLQAKGVSAGLAVNPGTSLASLDEALRFVDFVLVMSVDPGWGGQPFIPASLDRIARLRNRLVELGREDAVEIGVDGGVTERNAAALVAAGASHLVAGSAVFGRGEVGSAVAALRRAAQGLPS